MDNRKPDSMGALGITPPASKVPEGFNGHIVEEQEWNEEGLQNNLESGGLTAIMYYGCWDIWPTEKGFSGELMQYRAVTDEFEDEPLDVALGKAVHWATNCQG